MLGKMAKDILIDYTKTFFAFGLSTVLVLNPFLAYADGQGIRIDASTNIRFTPTMRTTQTNVPQMDIVEPDIGGTSHNKVETFNVGEEGVVINNSTIGGTSLIGGSVRPNFNLRGREASTVLIETTGADISDLEGPTEIFGGPAAFILANPYGVLCDGCGFINTPRVELSTRDADGKLENGKIEIGEGGFLGTEADDIRLEGGKIDINGVIVAKNKLELSSDGSASDNEYAIDASHLGAMQAGSIKIIATGDGVGVRADGDMIAFDGDLQIHAGGKVAIKGNTVSQKNTEIETANDIIKTTDTVALGSVLFTGRNITTYGNYAVGEDVVMKAVKDLRLKRALPPELPETDTTPDPAPAAETPEEVTPEEITPVELSLEEVTAFTADVESVSQTHSRSDTAMVADTIDLAAGGVVENELDLFATGDISISGLGGVAHNNVMVLTDGKLHLHSNRTITHQNALLNSAGRLTIDAEQLENTTSVLETTDTGDIEIRLARDLLNQDGSVIASKTGLSVAQAGVLDNRGSMLFSQEAMHLAHHGGKFDGSIVVAGTTLTIDNTENMSAAEASIESIGEMSFNITGDLVAPRSMVLTESKLNINTGSAELRDASLNAENIVLHAVKEIKADRVEAIASNGDVAITSDSRAVWLTQSRVLSVGDFSVTALWGTLFMDGTHAAVIGKTELNPLGLLDADNTIIKSGDNVTMRGERLNAQGAIIESFGDVSFKMTTSHINLTNVALYAERSVVLDSAADVIIDGGFVGAKENISVTSARHLLAAGSQWSSGGNMQIHAGGAVDFSASDIAIGYLDEFDVVHGGNLTLESNGAAWFENAAILTLGNMSISGTDIHGNQSVLIARDAVTLSGKNQINLADAMIDAKGISMHSQGDMSASGLDVISRVDSVNIEAAQIDLSKSTLASESALSLNATQGNLELQEATIESVEAMDLTAGGNLNAAQSVIKSGGDLSVNAVGDVDWYKAYVISGGAVNVNAQGAFSFAHLLGEDALLHGHQGVTIDAATIDVTSSTISAGLVEEDTMVASAGISLSAGKVDATNASLLATESLMISGDHNLTSVVLTGALLDANDIAITSTSTIEAENLDAIARGGNLTMVSLQGDITLSDALLLSDASLSLSAANGILFLDRSQFDSYGGALLTATSITQRESVLRSDGDVSLTASSGGIDITGSRVISEKKLTLTASGALLFTPLLDEDVLLHGSKNVTVAAASINASGAVITSGIIEDETVVSVADTSLTATSGELLLNQSGISSTGKVTLSASGGLEQRQADIRAEQDVTVAAATLDQTEALVQSGGKINMTTSSGGVLQQESLLFGYGDISISSAGNIENGLASIISAGDVTLSSTNFRGDDSGIFADGNIAVSASNDILLNNAAIEAGYIDENETVHGGALSLVSGRRLNIENTSITALNDVSFSSGDTIDADKLVLYSQGGVVFNSPNTLYLTEASLDVASLQLNGSYTLNAKGLQAVTREGDLEIIRSTTTLDLQDAILLSAADLTVTNAGGRLTLNNAVLESLGNTTLAAQDDLNIQQSNIHSVGDMALASTQEDIQANGASIASEGEMVIAAAKTYTQNIPTGETENTALHATKGLNLTADEITLTNTDVTVGEVTESGEVIAHAVMESRIGDIRLKSSQFVSTGDIHLAAAKRVDNAAGLISGQGNVTVTANQLNNRDGEIESGKILSMVTTGTSSQFDNIDGRMVGIDGLVIDANGRVTNTRGELLSKGDITINVAEDFQSNQSQIIGEGHTQVAVARNMELTDSILHAGRLLEDETVTGSLALYAGERITLNNAIISVYGDTLIQAKTDIQASAMDLLSDGNVSFSSLTGGLTLREAILDGKSLTLAGVRAVDAKKGQFNARGTIHMDSQDGLTLTSAVLRSSDFQQLNAKTITADNVLLASEAIIKVTAQGGELRANGAQMIAGDEVNLSASGRITLSPYTDNEGNLINAFVHGDNAVIMNGKGITANGSTITAGVVDEEDAILTLADVTLATTGDRLDINQATIFATGDAIFHTPDQINATGAVIQTMGKQHYAGSSLTTSQATLLADDDISIQTISGRLTNIGGTIISNNVLEIDAAQGVTNQDDGTMVASAVVMKSNGRVTNENATIAGYVVDIDTADGVTNDGAIAAEDVVILRAGGHVTNNGTLQANETLIIEAKELSNDGTIQMAQGSIVTSSGITNNNQLVSNGELVLTSQGEVANKGVITSQNAVSIASGQFNSEGEVSANSLLITSTQFTNKGTINVTEDAGIAASQSITQSGDITAASLLMTTPGSFTQSGTLTTTSGKLWVLSDNRFTNTGTLTAAGDLVFSGTDEEYGGDWHNEGNVSAESIGILSKKDIRSTGDFTSRGDTYFTASAGVTQAGTAEMAGDFYVNAGSNGITTSGTMKADTLFLQSGGDIRLSAPFSSDAEAVMVAEGAIQFNADMNIASLSAFAARDISVQGNVTSDENITFETLQRFNANGSLTGKTLYIGAVGGVSFSPKSVLKITEEALIETAGSFTFNGQASADSLLVSANTMNFGENNVIEVNKEVVLESQGNVTHNGSLSAAELVINADSLRAQGNMTIAGNSVVTLNREFTHSGTWQSQGGLLVRTNDSVLNTGSLLLGDSLIFTGKEENGTITGWINSGEIKAKDLAIYARGWVQNNSLIEDMGRTVVSTESSFSNNGNWQTAGTFFIQTSGLSNDGLLQSGDDMTILTLGAVSNDSTLRSQGNLFIGVNGSLNNDGLIEVAGMLQMGGVEEGGLLGVFLNNSEITAGALIVESNGSITNHGLIQTNGDMVMLGKTIFDNTGSVLSNGNLGIATEIEIDNRGSIASAGDMRLTSIGQFGGNILNTSRISSGGSLALTAGGRLLNDGGLIQSEGDLYAFVEDDLENLDGAAFYSGGNAVFIADRIKNINSSYLLAGESMYLGGEDNTRNDLIHNVSSVIETSNGDLTIRTKDLQNKRTVLTFEDRQLSRTFYSFLYHPLETDAAFGWEDYVASLVDEEFKQEVPVAPESFGSYQVTDPRQVQYILAGRSRVWAGHRYFSGGPKGPLPSEGYGIAIEEYGRLVIENSPASFIVSGNNMLIDAENVWNDASHIAALGDISSVGSNLHNKAYIQTKETHVVCEYSEVCRGYSPVLDEQGLYPGYYLDGRYESLEREIESIEIFNVIDATIFAGGDMTGHFSDQINNENIQEHVDSVAIGVDFATHVDIEGGTAPVNQVLDTASLIRIPQGNNGLYRLATWDETTGGDVFHFIQTNINFNAEDFIGSDYLLTHAGITYDGSVILLGDAYYETQLVKQSILNQTGRRYLDESITSDYDQMRYLLDNAADVADALNLEVGIALTDTQISQLDKDIIWLVEQNISGQDVLVPVVYLSANREAAPGGATITAQNITLQGGDILNQGGNIIGHESVALLAERNIQNTGGTIYGGDNVALTAGGAIINESTIAEKIFSQAPPVEDFSSVFATPSSELKKDEPPAWVNNMQWRLSLGQINSGGDVQLLAGNILNVGADINADGSIILDAVHNAVIGAQQYHNQRYFEYDEGYVDNEKIENLGSNLTAGDSIVINSGNGLQVQASHLIAENTIDLNAGNSLEITSAENVYTTEAKHKSGGWKKSKTSYESQTVRQQESLIAAGGDIRIRSGGDAVIAASTLRAGYDVNSDEFLQLRTALRKDKDYSDYKQKTFDDLEISSVFRKAVDDVPDIKAEIDKTHKGGFAEAETPSEYNVAENKNHTGIGGGQLVEQINESDENTETTPDRGNITITAAEQLRFEVRKDVDYESYERTSNTPVWQTSKSKGHFHEYVRHTSINAKGKLGIYADDIVVEYKAIGDLEESLEVLIAENPDLAWMKEIKEQDRATWLAIEEAHEEWSQSNSSMSGAAMAIIAIVITAVTFWTGVGATLGAAMIAQSAALSAAAAGVSASVSAAAAAMANAAFATLATKVVTSLANNQGRVGDAFKELASEETVRALAISVISAGVTAGVLSNIPTVNVGDSTFATNLVNDGIQNVASATLNSGLDAAINGTDFWDTYRDSLIVAGVNTAGGAVTSEIGSAKHNGKFGEGWAGQVLHKGAHAAVGCARAAATNENCAVGAAGAVVGEITGELYRNYAEGKAEEFIKQNPNATEEQVARFNALHRTRGSQLARVTSGVSGAFVGGDESSVYSAANIGGDAAERNAFFVPFLVYAALVSSGVGTGLAIVGDGNLIEGAKNLNASAEAIDSELGYWLATEHPEVLKALKNGTMVAEELGRYMPVYAEYLAARDLSAPYRAEAYEYYKKTVPVETREAIGGVVKAYGVGTSVAGGGIGIGRWVTGRSFKESVMPEYVFSSKAPQQVTPGTNSISGQYFNNKGRVEPWVAYYDEYGRLKGRTDYNAGNRTQGIPDTHYHVYEWGPGKTPKPIRDHVAGEYQP